MLDGLSCIVLKHESGLLVTIPIHVLSIPLKTIIIVFSCLCSIQALIRNYNQW